MDLASGFAGKKILITGAGGFIGSHLAEWLARVECTLTLADRGPARPADPAAKATVERAALDTCSRAFREMLIAADFDYIFHFAGNANVTTSVQQPDLDFRQNCVATFEMLEAMRTSNSRAVFVYASSAAVYGNPVSLPIAETDLTVPISPYGVSKLAAERYVRAYCALYGLKGVSLRMFSPFGPRLRKQIVFDLTRKVMSGNTLKVLGDGSQTRDFIYISDLISAILTVTRFAPHDGDVYNIGSGTGTSTATIATELVRLVNSNVAIEYTHTDVAGNPERWCADIGKLTRLGWQPSVALEAGLADTVDWISREYS